MQKIGIISDIHSNKEALYRVLNDMEKRGIDRVICLGDNVTKYIYPREVVETLKTNCDLILKGNCDQNVVTNENFRYARRELGLNNIEFLASLPEKEQIAIQGLLVNFFHATATSLNTKFMPNNGVDPKEMFIGSTPQITIAGHTHIPFMAQMRNGKLEELRNAKVFLEKNKNYIFNVGSVGEREYVNPNGQSEFPYLIGDSMTYGILTVDTDKPTMEIVHVPYQDLLIKVYQDFINNQRPNSLGERHYPRFEDDTTRIHDSLLAQGVTDIPEVSEIDTPLEEDDENQKRL